MKVKNNLYSFYFLDKYEKLTQQKKLKTTSSTPFHCCFLSLSKVLDEVLYFITE